MLKGMLKCYSKHLPEAQEYLKYYSKLYVVRAAPALLHSWQPACPWGRKTVVHHSMHLREHRPLKKAGARKENIHKERWDLLNKTNTLHFCTHSMYLCGWSQCFCRYSGELESTGYLVPLGNGRTGYIQVIGSVFVGGGAQSSYAEVCMLL